jgi:hypothetical protein
LRGAAGVLIHAGVQLTAEDIRSRGTGALTSPRTRSAHDRGHRPDPDSSPFDELDTKGVDATSHVVAMETPFRPDVVTSTPSVESSLANAPEREDGFFVVPAIIE